MRISGSSCYDATLFIDPKHDQLCRSLWAGRGPTYLLGGDVLQLDRATFILLAHTQNRWLENFTGLQNENLKGDKN